MKKIIVGADHVSVSLKEVVIAHLRQLGIEVTDAGTYRSDIVVDYPDYGEKVARSVVKGEHDSGIIICGTGLGISMAANKVPGARAALCTDTYTAEMSRAHNDANILAMGAKVVTSARAVGIVDTWLNTPYDGGRHIPRVTRLNHMIVEDPSTTTSLSKAPFQFGVALSISETSFGPVMFGGRLVVGLQALAGAGFARVELSVRSAGDIDAQWLSSTLQSLNLSVSAFATGQGCIHDHLCLSTTDAELKNRAIQRMKDIIDLGAEFKAPIILGGVRGRFSGTPQEMEAQRVSALDSIQLLAGYASQKAVNLLLEPINRYETNFINTVAEGLALIEELGSPENILLVPDTYHMNIEEADMPTALRQAGSRLGYLHFADSNRLSPGQGHIDFKTILQTLVRTGYHGGITAEILPLPDETSAIQRASNYLASLLNTNSLQEHHNANGL